MSEAIDAKLIEMIPAGHRFSLVWIAIVKRLLADQHLKPGERLDLLEKLNAVTDSYLDADMLAAVSPASDVETQIFLEAATLDGSDERCRASFNVLTRGPVFLLFRSLLPAIQMKEGPRCSLQA
jgi:hypothetical protein